MEKLLKRLLKKYSLEEIEWNLIKFYITKNKVNINYSEYLKQYLNLNLENKNLEKEIEEISESTIILEDLVENFELLIPEKDRKLNGAFFTPRLITNFMVYEINPKLDDKNIDISCGSGAFLITLIRYYKKKYNKTLKKILEENIFGVDILDYNIIRCKLMISILACEFEEKIDEKSMNLFCLDALTNLLEDKFPMKFDNILGNPPYVKYQDLPEEMREKYTKNFKTAGKGSYNTYFLFFEKAYDLLEEKGNIIYITPNNYFTSLAGEKLREFFQEKKCVKKIIDFSNELIFSVQTYTAITILKKEAQNKILYEVLDRKIELEKFLENLNFNENKYERLNFKKWRLLKESETDAIWKIENEGNLLGDIVDIRASIATLKDKVYSIIPEKEDEKYIYINDNIKIEREITKPLVKITEIKEENELMKNKRRIIFPYKIENGKNKVMEEEELKKNFPETYEYLLSNKEELLAREKGKIMEKIKKWYEYGRTQGLNNIGEKILIPTHSSVPRFLYDKRLDSFFTNGYAIFFNEKKYLKHNNLLSLVENFDVLQKILNSSLMDYFIKRTSTSISGGHYCYQKNFIELFSVPKLTVKEIKILREIKETKEIDEFLKKIYNIEKLI